MGPHDLFGAGLADCVKELVPFFCGGLVYDAVYVVDRAAAVPLSGPLVGF